jgi:hypothetical protein
MEIFLQRLLIEVAAIALQLAILRLVSWMRDRSTGANSTEGIVLAT